MHYIAQLIDLISLNDQKQAQTLYNQYKDKLSDQEEADLNQDIVDGAREATNKEPILGPQNFWRFVEKNPQLFQYFKKEEQAFYLENNSDAPVHLLEEMMEQEFLRNPSHLNDFLEKITNPKKQAALLFSFLEKNPHESRKNAVETLLEQHPKLASIAVKRYFGGIFGLHLSSVLKFKSGETGPLGFFQRWALYFYRKEQKKQLPAIQTQTEPAATAASMQSSKPQKADVRLASTEANLAQTVTRSNLQ